MPDSPNNLQSPRHRWLAERQRFLDDGPAAHLLLKQANGSGEHLLAVEIAEAVLTEGHVDPAPILQQMGRALGSLGSSDEARATLERIAPGRPDAAETFGLLGRIWKDLAAAATTPEEKVKFFLQSRDNYATGFRIALEHADAWGAAYCGINAAAVSVWLDDLPGAADFAAKTLDQIPGGADYYAIATRAEAALILGNDPEATDLYRQAGEIAGLQKRWADLASTRKQCRELCLELHGRRDRFDAAFPSGSIGIFSGDVISDFPAPEVEEALRAKIVEWIKETPVREVFGSARAGWELIALDAAANAGVDIHLILPCPPPEFIAHVIGPHGDAWTRLFEKISSRSVSTSILAGDHSKGCAGETEFTERMIAARGALLADHLGFSLRALAIGDDFGDTALGFWQRANLDFRTIDPAGADSVGPAATVEAGPAVPFQRALASPPSLVDAGVRAVLHLHFAGYGILKNEDFEGFQKAVLGTIAARFAASPHPPVARQGFAGDYLFVFDELHPAGVAALEIMAAIKETGSPIPLPSICLHAGPVRQMINPLLNFYAHEGAVITRAGAIARQLPPAGSCATETFTALAALESLRGFRFEHAGKIQVNSSSERLFRILPA